MTEFIKIAYSNLPSGVPVNQFGGIIFPTPFPSWEDMIVVYPFLFWAEPDLEGVDRLCTTVIVGTQFPTIGYGIGSVSHPLPFELYYAIADKTTGDRGWHPGSRPPRPL